MDKLLPWMVLLGAPKLGSSRLLRLLEIYKDVNAIITASQDELGKCGLTQQTIEYISRQDHPALNLQLSWLQEPGNHLVTIVDTDYPPYLKTIPDPPVALFISGSLSVLQEKQIAIVGSRNPTAAGRNTARLFATLLVELEMVITSGLATGIDSSAHCGALDADGRTIAVLGNGPDIVYPARNNKLVHRIRENGALISEYPPGIPPLAGNFPRRNRIISGLCSGVIVIEAAVRSGSLITARLANDYGREVFAVPGSIYNPLSSGCHYLIKQGAKLTETIVDVIEELNLEINNCLPNTGNINEYSINQEYGDSPEMQKLLAHMGFDPVTINTLIENTGLTAETVSSMLCLLEVQGQVASEGGFYSRIK